MLFVLIYSRTIVCDLDAFDKTKRTVLLFNSKIPAAGSSRALRIFAPKHYSGVTDKAFKTREMVGKNSGMHGRVLLSITENLGNLKSLPITIPFANQIYIRTFKFNNVTFKFNRLYVNEHSNSTGRSSNSTHIGNVKFKLNRKKSSSTK